MHTNVHLSHGHRAANGLARDTRPVSKVNPFMVANKERERTRKRIPMGVNASRGRVDNDGLDSKVALAEEPDGRAAEF